MSEKLESIYNDFYGNFDRLKGEWDLCTKQHNEIINNLLNNKHLSLDQQLKYKIISGYWMRRRNALEYSLSQEQLERISK